jgi:MoaA/NifB/PqqE/SkfB family radical SAM enzyme
MNLKEWEVVKPNEVRNEEEYEYIEVDRDELAKDITYNAIKKLTDLGMTQINIHFVLSEETFELAKQLMEDVKKDSRLAKLNAIVFLGIKNKGRAEINKYTPLDKEKFKELIHYAIQNNIGVGFDSCSAGKFMNAIEGIPEYQKFVQLAEPCESLRMSMYIDVNGIAYPCSFATNTLNWEDGIDLLRDNINFQKDFWFHPRVVEFRKKCIQCNSNDMTCPVGYII